MDSLGHGGHFGFTTDKNDYQLDRVIGQGATAMVMAATFTHPETKQPSDCAIKLINLDRRSENMNDIAKEVQYMLMCRHQNIVNYYKSFVVKNELWLVMNLLGGGSVYDIIKHRQNQGGCENGVLEEVEIATVLQEALKGLEYLHANGQIHRDIKAGNILLGCDGSVQLGDFGVSAMISTAAGDRTEKGKRETFVGTVCWMAPEVMEQAKGYDSRADIWSLGIVAIEMVTGSAPYNKYPPMKVILLTLQNNAPNLDTVSSENKDKYKKYSKDIRKFISKCLQKEPGKRPPSKDLLKDSFFKKSKSNSKEFIVNRLLITVPDLKDRGKKIRRVKGSSGRFHKLEEGGWEFSDEECEEEDENTKTMRGMRLEEPEPTMTPQVQPEDIQTHESFTLTLRIRSQRGELQDVSFPFVVNMDTASAVAQEMMQSRIIESEDMLIVASKISDLVDAHSARSVNLSSIPESERMCRFKCRTGSGAFQEPSVDELKGYAQLTIASTVVEE